MLITLWQSSLLPQPTMFQTLYLRVYSAKFTTRALKSFCILWRRIFLIFAIFERNKISPRKKELIKCAVSLVGSCTEVEN